MFALAKQSARIAHLNVREEKHGEEDVLAVDVKVSADVPNGFLDGLSPGLKAALYDRSTEDLALEEGHLSVLRFPQLEPLDWDREMKLAHFTIHGARKSEDLEFFGDVNKLRLVCKEGGTVSISFRVQLLPEPEEVGDLTSVLGQSVKVSVKPVPQADTPPVE